MSIGLHQVSPNQAENRAKLAEGVKGVECTQAASYEMVMLNLGQQVAVNSLRPLLAKAGCQMGTIEVYANGAMNIYIRSGDRVVGFALYRP